MALVNFFDPTTWLSDNHECRIYSDDYANQYAIVDQIDYQYLIQWRWKLKESRSWQGTKRPKTYLARSSHEVIGKPSYDEDGKWLRAPRLSSTIFLHTEVIERMNISKPVTNSKIIVDHADGDEFNCRRINLRYTTISFNNKNRYGSHEHMLITEDLHHV